MNEIIRTHMTNLLDIQLIKVHPADQSKYSFKPKGFWYAIGNAWIDWCKSEMPDWINPYVYTINILTENNMLYLDSKESVILFTERYEKEIVPHYKGIDWEQVNKDYDGVEFNPYFYDIRFSFDHLWYSGIDVPSGVIFNTDIIDIKNILLNKSVKND